MKIPKPRKLANGTYFIQLRLGGESIPVSASTEKACKAEAALIKAQYKAGQKKKSKKKGPALRGSGQVFRKSATEEYFVQ